MDKIICKRCLLNKVFSEEEYNHMKEYVAAIDSNIKTAEDEYNKRLSICQQCENLINGMCKRCGCFVEVRAAVKNNYCPDIDKKW